MMVSGTPMGPAKPRSRLDRLYEAEQLLWKLQAAGMTREQIGQAIGRSVGTVGKWARALNKHRCAARRPGHTTRGMAEPPPGRAATTSVRGGSVGQWPAVPAVTPRGRAAPGHPPPATAAGARSGDDAGHDGRFQRGKEPERSCKVCEFG